MDTKVIAGLTDAQLLEAAHSLAAGERAATAELIAALVEIDHRRLYLGLSYSSMFAFCVARLHLSESAAYARTEAARVAGRYPRVLELLLDGSINLTTVSLLGSHLTAENHDELLRAAIGKRRREVEMQVAALRPLPPAPVVIRKLPQPRTAVESFASIPLEIGSIRVDTAGVQPNDLVARPTLPPARPAVVTPLSPERFKIQLTIGRETYDKLRRAQDLLRCSVPNGDLAAVIDRALTALLERLEKHKCGSTSRSTNAGRRTQLSRSRYVPASIRRKVWACDEGRCTFVGTDGRCEERGFLEIHHIVPYADGGATDLANLQLRCRAHNQYEAELVFGQWKLREKPVAYFSRLTGSGPS
jgi:5-methylcytosine-specific restriction endonuclease McrA